MYLNLRDLQVLLKAKTILLYAAPKHKKGNQIVFYYNICMRGKYQRMNALINIWALRTGQVEKEICIGWQQLLYEGV